MTVICHINFLETTALLRFLEGIKSIEYLSCLAAVVVDINPTKVSCWDPPTLSPVRSGSGRGKVGSVDIR